MSSRIGKNILSLGFSRIISGVILFLVYVRLVTYLGPGEFGKFSLVLAYYTIFSLLIDLGISRFVIKKVSEDKNAAPIYLGNFMVAQFFLSLVVFGLFFVIPRVLHYEADLRSAMGLAGFGLFLGSLAIPYAAIVQAWQRLHILAVVNFANTLIHAGWLVSAMIFNKPLVFLFWLYAIIGIVDLIIYWWFARRLTSSKFTLDFSLLKTLLLMGVPFAFISGFEMLIAKIDVVIQKFYLPFTQVGLYSAAYRFLDFLTFIPAVVAISLFPYVSSQFDLKTPEVRQTFNRLNRYLLALAIPLGVGATILADKIILSLFDERYLGATLPFQILIWATVLTFIYAVPNVMMIVRQTRKALGILGAVTLLNVLTNIILVPRFGILASAWITVLSYLLVAVFYIFYSRKLSSFDIFKYAPIPLAASAVMGLAVWLIRELNIFAVIAADAALYVGILILMQYLRKEDWEFVKSIFTPHPRPLPASPAGRPQGEREIK